jgi:PHD/YefM family antitoxin component YafN of YafNO toxin-antitoxin module
MAKQKPISTTYLRANIYRLLDDVARTGKPLLISRKGKLVELRLVSEQEARQRGLSYESPR